MPIPSQYSREIRKTRATNQKDPLKLVRTDEAILIVIEVLERLAEAFALQALHELCELIIWTTAD